MISFPLLALVLATAARGAPTDDSAKTSNVFKTVLDQPLSSFSVLPAPYTDRNFSVPFAPGAYINGTASTKGTTLGGAHPYFQVFNSALAQPILGKNPSLRVLLYEKGYAFAHEAPVYFSDTDDLYFCSDAGGALGRSNLTKNNIIRKLNVGTILKKLSSGGNATLEKDTKELNISSDGVQMTNGGTNYKNDLLVINSGRGDLPGSIALIPRLNPSKAQVLLNNAFGKQFNAPNDVVVHPCGRILFTDADYAYLQGFGPQVQLPKMTWQFDPSTGELTALEDSVNTPNGLVLSPDAKTLYIGDTGAARGGPLANDYSVSPSIYAWDVMTTSGGFLSLSNKRLFTWSETGIADGLKVDSSGNLYAGTGDGVAIFSPNGRPIAKIYLPQGAVNLVFATGGKLVITAQEYIWIAQLDSSVEGSALETYPSS